MLQSFENPQQLESQDIKVIGQIGQVHEMPGGPQGIWNSKNLKSRSLRLVHPLFEKESTSEQKNYSKIMPLLSTCPFVCRQNNVSIC